VLDADVVGVAQLIDDVLHGERFVHQQTTQVRLQSIRRVL
jgi:hypothetical protein